WQNGSGIVSFKSKGQTLSGQLANQVMLGVNYWGDTEHVSGPFIPGPFGARVGYGVGVNITGNGAFGQRQDDNTSKIGQIIFHTKDASNDEGVSILAAPAQGGTYVSDLSGYFNAHFRTNGDIRFPFYPISRIDGVSGKFLTTDSIGNMILASTPS